jgi:hypothetical protein
MQKRDRFLFEEMIMQCWHVTDDVDTIASYVADSEIPAKHQDEIMNMLFGIKSIYNQRFNDTMNLFNELVENGQFRGTEKLYETHMRMIDDLK